MSPDQGRPLWTHRWHALAVVPIALFIGLALKLLVVGHLINPGDYPPTRSPVLTTFGILTMLWIPCVYLGARLRLVTALALNICGTAIALVDLWYFRFYRDVPSLADFDGTWQVGIALGSLVTLGASVDLAAGADILLAALYAVLLPKTAAHDSTRYRPVVVCGVLGLASLAAVSPVLAIARQDPDEVFEYAFERQEVVGAAGIAGYHVYDAVINVVNPLHGRLTSGRDDLDGITDTLATRDTQRLSSRLAGVAKGQNVIVLSAESLSSFVFGLEIDGQPIAPNLTAFARESLEFTEFFDQTHRGTTADAEFVSLNSLMPLPFGAASTRYASNDFRALPHVLQERGYSTLSACAEPPSFWNMGGMHPKLGFARSMFAPDFTWTRTVGVGLDDTSFFKQLVPTFRAEKDPFFAYLISSSNHHPYRLPDDLRRLRPESLPDGTAGDYLQSVRYFDEAFGQFVADLASSGILDRTVLVVFGDHQSRLEDADLQRVWRASGHAKDATELELWRFRRRVPLLIRLPHGAGHAPRSTPGGHLDITPTLLSLLGVEGVTGPWLGRDLTAPSRNVVVFRDGSVTNGANTLVTSAGRPPVCYTRDGRTIPCESVEALASDGREVLAASDAIIAGDLARAATQEFARRPQKKVRAPGRVLVIAHRGDSIHYPENTLEAIRAAFEAGADVVEVDVRLSLDGVPMVFHDDTLERTTNAQGAFARLSVREAQALDAGRWMSPRFAGTRIPTLEETLRVARGRGRLLLDLKVDGLAVPVRAVYERLNVSQEEALVGAWTPAQRSEFLREMPRALILKTEDVPVTWNASLFMNIRRQGLWGFELGDYWPPPFIAEARLHGVPVIAYTVNDEATLRHLIESGVSGIETDDPGLLVQVATELNAR